MIVELVSRDVTTAGSETLNRSQNNKREEATHQTAAKKMNNSIKKIRSIGVTKINQLVRAAHHLPQLRPAFAEWNAGEVYVCKKTGDYRYRFGDACKSVTPWNAIARELFTSPAALSLAALVLDDEAGITREPAPQAAPAARVNVIQMAAA